MQWIVLMVVGVALGALVGVQLVLTLLALWVMGCVYNLPPVRTKDHAYVDVARRPSTTRCACSSAGTS